MEGAGPAGGAPRAVGLVLASRDAVALDAVAQSLAGFGPDDIATTREAGRRGLGISDLAGIEIWARSLRRDRELAFYGAEDLIPSGFYSKDDATKARDEARLTVKIVRPHV